MPPPPSRDGMNIYFGEYGLNPEVVLIVGIGLIYGRAKAPQAVNAEGILAIRWTMARVDR
jgi:hypothetical protein